MSKIIFWGTPNFSVPFLEAVIPLDLVTAVVTRLDKPAGRGKKIQSSPVKATAMKNNIPVLDDSALDKNFIRQLQNYLPATFLVVAYGKIIPPAVLNLSELIPVNIHPSALPRLRGPAPIQWALRNGDNQTAVSLMQLDTEMDHGPILAQQSLKIDPNDDYFSLEYKISQIGVQMLKKYIKSYLAGRLSAQAQDDSQATYCRMIKKTDGIIDWSDTAESIHNQIRAFVQWPGAYTKLAGLDMKIKKSRPIPEPTLRSAEIKLDQDRLLVGTSRGALEILELQPAGKKTMSAAEFIRGYKHKLKMP